ncbi:class I SAM-dependent methyltransferase [Rubritalea marina]|uniref:class I SAM-dependent methyltransferase n=1 Tax=Rubritalea marina TaxID=361055 RepID=UPI00146130CF|nr:class I SAM-dependent methyltransferase [Rubritalea marina]
MRTIDYSRVARVYAYLERLVYGQILEDARFYHLEHGVGCLKGGSTKVLLVGGGDGRFLERLLTMLPASAVVDYVDCSSEMLVVARERVGEDARVRWHHERFENFSVNRYQLVLAHFFLDHYDGEEREAILEKITERADCGALMMLSDFDPSVSIRGRILLWTM